MRLLLERHWPKFKLQRLKCFKTIGPSRNEECGKRLKLLPNVPRAEPSFALFKFSVCLLSQGLNAQLKDVMKQRTKRKKFKKPVMLSLFLHNIFLILIFPNAYNKLHLLARKFTQRTYLFGSTGLN